MAYSPLNPTIYIGAAASYFTDTRPDELLGFVQRIRFNEGVDASRPFQRFRQSRLAFETVFVGTDAQSRPYQAGQLVWLQVGVGSAAATTWFRGLLLDPDYDSSRYGKVTVRMSALDVSDVLKEVISVANQTNGTIAENIGQLLDGVGWPDDADWRDIDADLIEQLSSWAHNSRSAGIGMQELTDTVGPPARMIIQRNGGIRVLKDVSDTVEAAFTDQDVIGQAKVKQHEDSVINTVTIEGTTLGSLSSTVRNRRPLDYDVLDGLAATERVNVIRRILRAYENGLTSLTFEVDADDDRNQADVAALLPGKVIELQSDTLNATHQGPVSGLRWRWERTRAFVQANVEVQPPSPEVFGVRLYLVGQSGPATRYLHIIDVETGIATQVDVGDSQVQYGLAYDPNADILYGAGDLALYRINPATGAGTEIGPFNASPHAIRGLAYDSVNDVLYGVGGRDAAGWIFTINVITGAATRLTNHTFASGDLRLTAAAFNPATHRLYTTGRGTKFFSVDPDDASATQTIPLTGGFSLIQAMAFDVGNQQLYAIAAYPWALYKIGLTGTTERVGTADNFGLSGDDLTLFGLAYMSLGSLVLDAPTGLALTTSGGDITATWDAVTDATGYTLEWREEGSGDAWQEVDVTTPPHTFTP